MTYSERMKSAAPVILRIGLALVFLWFGSQQLLHTAMWLGLIPKSLIAMTGFSAATFVHFNGAFEIVFGLCLFFGFFTRTVALLLALHMLDITFVVGYGATGTRDFGLSIAAISIFLYGVTSVSLDAWICKKMASKNSSVSQSGM